MKKHKIDRFVNGTFICELCGKRTRQTMKDNANEVYCEDCINQIMKENEEADLAIKTMKTDKQGHDVKFEWVRIVNMKHYTILPDFRQVKFYGMNKSKVIPIPKFIRGHFKCIIDKNMNIVMFQKTEETHNTFTANNRHIILPLNAEMELKWEKEQTTYRYIVNKDLFFVFLNKELIVALRRKFEGRVKE